MKIQFGCFVVVVGLATLSGCVTDPVTGERHISVMRWTPEEERELGSKIGPTVESQFDVVYLDAEASRYLGGVVAEMIRHSVRHKDFDFHFKILNSSAPNASGVAVEAGEKSGLLLSTHHDADLPQLGGDMIRDDTGLPSQPVTGHETFGGVFDDQGQIQGSTQSRAGDDKTMVLHQYSDALPESLDNTLCQVPTPGEKERYTRKLPHEGGFRRNGQERQLGQGQDRGLRGVGVNYRLDVGTCLQNRGMNQVLT